MPENAAYHPPVRHLLWEGFSRSGRKALILHGALILFSPLLAVCWCVGWAWAIPHALQRHARWKKEATNANAR